MQAFKTVIGLVLGAFFVASLPAQGVDPQAQEGVSSQAEGALASRLTLRLKDRELRDVVQSIRRKTSANIIMDADIEATVTIDLQDVHWRQALDLVAAAEAESTEGLGRSKHPDHEPREVLGVDKLPQRRA